MDTFGAMVLATELPMFDFSLKKKKTSSTDISVEEEENKYDIMTQTKRFNHKKDKLITTEIRIHYIISTIY